MEACVDTFPWKLGESVDYQELLRWQHEVREKELNELPTKNLSLAQASDFLRYRGRHEMEPLKRLRPRMHPNDWLTLLGDYWKSCEDLWDHKKYLRRLLANKGPLWPMMTAEDAECYRSLPDTVTIYRGCDRRWLTGLCWSLDRAVTESFPFMTRRKARYPVLITAEVPKLKIAAVLLGRGESEIVTCHAKRIKVEPLTGHTQD